MRKFLQSRFALMLLIVAVLAASQFLLRVEGFGGTWCVSDISLPGPRSHQTDVYTGYGFPTIFIATFLQGCFQGRTTRVYWYAGGLLVDIAFIAIVSTLPYWFSFLWRRFRRRDVA